MTLRTQFFWPQVLHSFCSNLMAFVWAVSQLCSSRACRQEGSESGSDCFLAPVLQGHWNRYSSAISHSDATSAHSSRKRAGCAKLHCALQSEQKHHAEIKEKAEISFSCCLEVEKKASSRLLLPRVGSRPECKWQPFSRVGSYSRGRQTTRSVGKTHDSGFSPAIRYIFNSSTMQFG